MTARKLVRELMEGEIDIEELKSRLEREAEEAAEAERARTPAPKERREKGVRRVISPELRRRQDLELELALARIQTAADRARSM
jgi:hypothetical protein